MTKINKIFCVAFLPLFLIGCIPTKHIEKTGIVNAFGIDHLDDDTLETSLVVFQFTEQAKSITKILSGKGETVQGSIEDAERGSLYKLVPGKLKMTVFGRELAERGVLPILDLHDRDPDVPDLLYLAIADTTAKELFAVDEKGTSTDIGQFLHALIERHSSDHNIPRKTLQDFIRIYYDIGHDNVVPIFTIVDGIPNQDKNALFKGDTIVGEISHKEALLINLMDLTVREYYKELTLPLEPFEQFREDHKKNDHQSNEFNITILITKGSSKTRVINPHTLTFETNTKINVDLVEQNADFPIKSNEILLLFEQEISKKMEQHFEKLLKNTQELQTDPFGYGRYYRGTHIGKDLTDDEWRQLYPTIDVKFNVDVKLQRHGANN